MRDLEFIRSVVKDWPDGALTVRLDKDGEICFKGAGHCGYDFFPNDIKAAKNAFSPKGGFYEFTGVNYSKEQWQGAKQ